MVSDVSREALQVAIQELHGCDSTWVEAVSVTKPFKNGTVWEGVVQVFDLIDHLEATRCYAWSPAIGDGEDERFVIMLHKEPVVTSARAAVRASIVQQAPSSPRNDVTLIRNPELSPLDASSAS